MAPVATVAAHAEPPLLELELPAPELLDELDEPAPELPTPELPAPELLLTPELLDPAPDELLDPTPDPEPELLEPVPELDPAPEPLELDPEEEDDELAVPPPSSPIMKPGFDELEHAPATAAQQAPAASRQKGARGYFADIG